MNTPFYVPSLRSRLGALLLTLLTLTGAFAQNYVQKTGTDNPFNGLGVSGGFPRLASADLDGDGDTDLLAGGFYGTIQYFKNTGTPTAPAFAEQTGANNPFDGIDVGYYSELALGDLDADGDVDLLLGGQDGYIYFYRNTGTATAPAFTQETGLSGPFDTVKFLPASAHPGLGDFDGDGDLDLLVGTSNGSTYYYQNKGTPSVPDFQLADPILLSVIAPNVNDVNGDGLLDVTGTTYNLGVRYFQNIGTAQEPVLDDKGNGPFAGLDVGLNPSVTIADLDGDGDGDAIIANRNGGINYFVNEPPLSLTQNPTPASATVCQGGSASSTVVATGAAPLTYQWYRNNPNTNEPVSGQTSATLSLSNVQPADAGTYYCRVSNTSGSVWSTAFTLTVTPTTAITGLTPSQGTCLGVPFTLSVSAVGGNLTYQWYRVASPFNQPVAGATASSLTLPAPVSGSYFVVVSGSCGPSVTSPTVVLMPAPPTILQVTSLVNVVCEGGNLTLSVRSSGVSNPQFSWRKDDPNGPVIGTGSSFTLSNAQVTDAGTYYASVAGTCTSPTVSIPVTVRYFRITAQPQSVNLCSGVTTLSVSVQAVGVTPTYQWKRNGANISGANQASYTVSYRTPGTYTVEVRTSCGNLLSQGAVVGCGNSRLAVESVEEPRLSVAPNPVVGQEIRCTVVGMETPEFRLLDAAGRSLGLRASGGEEVGSYRLQPAQAVPGGLYILQASQGNTRISQRVLLVE